MPYRKDIWTAGVFEFLLNHLEANKGENGSYYTKNWAAYAAESINKAFPDKSMSAEQVKNKLGKFKGRYALKNGGIMASMPDSGSQAILGEEMEVEAPHGSEFQHTASVTTNPGQHPESSSDDGSPSESDGSE